jgi:hypothetical protein
MCVLMCLCVRVYVYVCVLMCAYVLLCVLMCGSACVNVCVCVRVHAYIIHICAHEVYRNRDQQIWHDSA